MKILITLLVFTLNSVYSQDSDNIYQLGLNDENEVVRIITFIPFKSEKIIVNETKEKMILKLLAEKLKSKSKYKAHIICSGIGKSLDGSYKLSKSRACKFIESGELLYKAHGISVEDSVAELELVDKVLRQEYTVSEFDKAVVDSDRSLNNAESFFERSSKTLPKPTEALAK